MVPLGAYSVTGLVYRDQGRQTVILDFKALRPFLLIKSLCQSLSQQQ